MQLPSVLIIDGSLNGECGNTAALLADASDVLGREAHVTTVHLEKMPRFAEIAPAIEKADAFLFGTGTHWDSWSHRLQRFLEEATASEGSPMWLGKPTGVVVTMHSVGGKAVLSRLQGVLNAFGCSLPPMTGMVYSLVNQVALQAPMSPAAADVWSRHDVDVICHNLIQALRPSPQFRTWPIDRTEYEARWMNE